MGLKAYPVISTEEFITSMKALMCGSISVFCIWFFLVFLTMSHNVSERYCES